MITARLAKSKLENQEGLNHLWVRLQPIGDVDNARIQIILPPGIHRSKNISGFYENDTGEVIIYEPKIADEFFLEIYTEEPISCGNKTILLVLSYNNRISGPTRIEYSVSLEVVEDNEAVDHCLDEEVVQRIKEIRSFSNENHVVDCHANAASRRLNFISTARPKLDRKGWKNAKNDQLEQSLAGGVHS